MTDENATTAKPARKKAGREDKPVPRRVGGKDRRGKTKDGHDKWLLRIFRGYDAKGKRIYFSETFIGGSKDADKRLVELHNRHKAGLPLKFEPKLFKDFFDDWLDDRDDGALRECTIEHYRRAGRAYLAPEFGGMALTDITDVAVKRFYKRMREEGYAPATISLLHVMLSNLFKLAESRELIIRNPMAKVDAPAQPKPKPVAMNGDQVKAFIATAATRSEGFIFELAYFLGARPCEYLGLKWGDFDKKGSRITIQRSLKWRKSGDWYTTDPKTEKGVRTIALTPHIVTGLEAQRRRQLEQKMKAGASWPDHGFIFTDATGEPISLNHARHLHKKIAADAGLPDSFALKVSRHSCASAMLKAGVHPKIVSERLGHASIAITLDVYTVIEEDQQREASERLGEMFGMGKK